MELVKKPKGDGGSGPSGGAGTRRRESLILEVSVSA